MAMPYGEHRIKELQQSADITPRGIQLEVNAEIFHLIYNLIWNTQDIHSINYNDLTVLHNLWKETIQESSRIEQRKGYYIPMEHQIEMLHNAYVIERKYISDQVFTMRVPCKITPDLIEEEYKHSSLAFESLFSKKIWPSAIWNKTGNHSMPMAFIVLGQPGSGKTLLSSRLFEDWNYNIIDASADAFIGFHPYYKELISKYSQYTLFQTSKQRDLLSQLTIDASIKNRYHLLYESAFLENISIPDLIASLKSSGFCVWVILRTCSKKESWQSIHQLFLQQRLKAPGISRMITKAHHNNSCSAFLTFADKIIKQNLMDRLIIQSSKGLVYDSDDLPTERAIDILIERLSSN